MNPCHETDLPQDILDLLVEYYNNLYNDDRFIAISSVMSPNNDIVVNYKIKQCAFMVRFKQHDMKNRHIY